MPRSDEPIGGTELAYGADYEERVTLRDGTEVLLRPIRPQDKLRLAQALGRLSPESRYRRFLTIKGKLTAAELKYLTEVDGLNHVALGAAIETEEGEEGIGIARFVRTDEDPESAEAAVAVVDAYHRRGLGRTLLDRLAKAAMERGITHFRAVILESNEPIRKLIGEEALRGAILQTEDDSMVIDIPLSDEAFQRRRSSREAGLLHRVFSAVGAGRLVIKRAIIPLTPGSTQR